MPVGLMAPVYGRTPPSRRPQDLTGHPADSASWHPWNEPPAQYLSAMLAIIPRGFTGHEHIEHANIVHMNARIYDPHLGRFLQADGLVEDSTTLNRYTYVHNNPLAYTDPSGNFSLYFTNKATKKMTRSIMRAIGPEASSTLVSVGCIAANVYYAACVAGGNYDMTRAFGGSQSDAFRNATIAGVTAYAFQMSNTYLSGGTRIATNSVIGGTSSVLQGGKFGHGFAAAGLGAAAGPVIRGISDNPYVQGTTAAILGGTISEVTGGKFANGAATAAMAYAFSSIASRNRGNAVGSSSGSGADPVEVPGQINVEQSGFPTSADAAKAAGAKYGQAGVDSRREVQLGIVKLGDKNFGYLTPGWGPVGSDIVDPSGLISAYRAAGYKPFAWMHGHFDNQLNFSSNDFWMVWEKPGSAYLVNRNLEVRRLQNHHLQTASRNIPLHYPSGLTGLKRYYGEDGIPGDRL